MRSTETRKKERKERRKGGREEGTDLAYVHLEETTDHHSVQRSSASAVFSEETRVREGPKMLNDLLWVTQVVSSRATILQYSTPWQIKWSHL